MGIQITPGHYFLHVTGDIRTVLRVPSDTPRYWVTLSDGTLLEGHCTGTEHSFRVALEGAGFTRIDGPNVEHDWKVEWAAVSPFEAAAVADRHEEPLPLLEAMRGLVADV